MNKIFSFGINKNQEQTKWIYCFGIIALFLVPYGIINNLPLHRYSIPFFWGEERIPFLPWTFIIYLSCFIQGAFAIRLTPRKFLPKALFAVSCLVFISLIFFIFFPIEYPRDLYPSSNLLVNFFRNTDGAGNCFPSLHVAISILLAFSYGLYKKSFNKKVLMWFWSILIIISTLTTKQHYLIDVFGGIILAIPFMLYLRKEYLKFLKMQ